MDIERKNKKIHISVLHLAAFLLVYLSAVLLFLIFRGYTFLVLWLTLTALVPGSFYLVWRLAGQVEGLILIEQETARPGETVEIVISVRNSSYFFALRSVWFLTIGNSFYETSDKHRLLLAIPPRRTRRFPMQVTVTDLGRTVFACQEYDVCDLLGIFSIHADCIMEGCLCILPSPKPVMPALVSEAHSGVAELSESSRKGNDHSEISDIRTYRAGDRPKDIHWKLSARNKELLVKERVSLAGSEHVLLLDLPHTKAEAEQLLTEGYHLIRQLLDAHLTIRLLVWNQQFFSFESSSVGCLAELDRAYCRIYCTRLSDCSSALLQKYMQNCYPLLESYLYVTQSEGAARLEVIFNG